MFPKNFLWGTATAAYQVEGGNINTDVWAEEHADGSPYADKSGDIVDHYRLYREDIKLMAQLGLKVYRFSIEWARIEPEAGYCSKSAIEHYRDVLQTCHENKIIPMVTMHHFTSPRWLMQLGGWKNPDTADRFARYCEVVFQELGDLIPYVLTMNEVNLPVMLRELFINFQFIPPVGISAESWTAPQWRESAAKNCGTTLDNYFTFHMASDEQTIAIIKDAHRKAWEVIKKIQPATKVGWTLALPDVQSVAGGEEEAEKAWHNYFQQYLDAIQGDDFLGLQNYTRKVYGPNGQIFPDGAVKLEESGYEYYPESLAGVIRKVAKEIDIPIVITEHGIATADDEQRVAFIKKALDGVYSCITDGIKVNGYIYWSTFDNFEWMFGYKMHFGVIAVDRSTQQRFVKYSARLLGEFAQNNGLPKA